MAPARRRIEVDDTTASALEARAAEQGRSVADLLADIAAAVASPASLDPAELAELDRRSVAADAPEATVRHGDVVAWLETWGTPAFKPWHRK